MKYYLDTEFNEFGGDLISLALIREDGASLYLVAPCERPGAWVAQNVIPVLDAAAPIKAPLADFGLHVYRFMRGDNDPQIVTDWPDDVRYFCQILVVGPGQMINIPRVSFHVERVDAYPTTLAGAVQHNAWWDAMALRHLLNARTPWPT